MILGLTDDEFFALTPRQFHILLKRHKEVIEHEELLTGILACTFANYTANWSMSPPKRGLGKVPSDFMPCKALSMPVKKKRRNRKKEQKRVTEQLSDLMAMFRARGAQPGGAPVQIGPLGLPR